MKNTIKSKTLIYLMALLVGAGLFQACSDWRDVEAVDINEPNIEGQNPELYAQYLENLRSYKNSDHKYVYAWYDNSVKVPFNRSHHLTDLPDSIDVVVMMYPENLADWEQEEMASIRENKGTKTMFVIDYDLLKATHDLLVFDYESGNAPDMADPGEFTAFLTDSLTHKLALADTYNYDGIVIAYNGKSTLLMEDDELLTYTTNEELFFNTIKAWMALHSTKNVVYQGYPQYIIDKTALTSYKHIVIPTMELTSQGALTYAVLMACEEGVPTDRFVVMAQTQSLDSGDTSTGYWIDGTAAITSAAEWVAGIYGEYTIGGLGMYNVNNDFYNPALTYPTVREAIDLLNPSL